ncbi:MAG: hypothetical protein ACI9T9_002989 [Oleiphilaceae bacterium]|jgi:hypothetical protein
MLNHMSVLIPSDSDAAQVIAEAMVVAAIFPKRDAVWLLPFITSGQNTTKNPDKKPTKYDVWTIESAISAGELDVNQLTLDPYKDVPEEHLLDSNGNLIPSAKERDRRFAIVLSAMAYEDELFYPTHGNGVIANVAKLHKVTRHNVQRYLNEYFRGGRHKNALIPKTGRHKREHNLTLRKIGAPRKTAVAGVNGKNVDATDLVRIKKVAKKYYLNKKGTSVKALHGKLLDEEYAAVKGKILQDGTFTPTVHLQPNEQISVGQLRYWLPKALGISREDLKAKRRQTPNHKSNFAGRTGNADYIADGPGHIFQMDSTELDIELVSPYDLRVRLTKVTFYAVRDAYTRAYVGIHMAAGKASWYEARLALLATFRDKVQVAAEWGINLFEDDWIESGIPQILFVDNEEFANKISSTVGKDLGITVQFSRAYSGDDKGLVESSFRAMHAMIKNEGLAGYQQKGLIGRNRQIPAKNAALTPRELQQILILYAVYHNRCIWKDDYPMEQAAKQQGVKDTCRDYWEWGLKYRNYYLTKMPLRTLFISLLESGEVSVNRNYLLLKDKRLRYRSTDVRLLGLQNKKVGRENKPTLICRYLRSTVNVIFIELQGKLVQAELHSSQQAYKNLSHAQFQVAMDNNDINRQLHEQSIQSQRSAFSQVLQAINANAIKNRSKFIDAATSPPILNTQTATQLQTEDSYAIDNYMLDIITSGLTASEQQTSVLSDSDAHKQVDIEDLIEDSAQDSDAIDIFNDILEEMNHE